MTQDNLVVKKKLIKELAQEHGFRMSGDSYEAANDCLLYLLKNASRRAKANGRLTIISRDW